MSANGFLDQGPFPTRIKWAIVSGHIGRAQTVWYANERYTGLSCLSGI